MAIRPTVTPNRRGVQSREAVLDAAERVMATHGYDGASVARIVTESGIPMSSVYHYFGSKDGVLLAVMERGAEHFFDSMPQPNRPLGPPLEHMTALVAILRASLHEHPDFLRLVVVMATQPLLGDAAREVHEVVGRVREGALRRLRRQAAIAFGIDEGGALADRLALFALAVVDGAFVGAQAPANAGALDRVLDQLPVALVALAAADGDRSPGQ